MIYRYYNANPRQLHVNDCTVRAISLATKKNWDQTYQELSDFARAQAIMPDDVNYIDEYWKGTSIKFMNEKATDSLQWEILSQTTHMERI